jgi:hypothetical protein
MFKKIIKSDHFFTRCQLPEDFVALQQKRYLEQLSKETTQHCDYLTSIGLADRATYFKVKPFVYQSHGAKNIDISRFRQSMALPEEVRTFNINEKNTLFTRDETSATEKDQEEINRVLAIRLYPAVRKLIQENETCVVLGSKMELQEYAESNREKILIEIEVPSSVKFYIALNSIGAIKIYIGSLVSHENLIQQLVTLKLAEIDLQKISLLGDTKYYASVCKKDLLDFEKQSSAYRSKRNALIVAGCSLEETVCSTFDQIFAGDIIKHQFSGDLVSLTYVQSEQAPNLGFIILNLNYGEICEAQISAILEKFNCIGVFSGSAAGFIPNEPLGQLPAIGERIAVQTARHHSGEVVSMDPKSTNLHMQVPTIFFETFNWLNDVKNLRATTVDVETFYILRAIYKYQKVNPQEKIHQDIGVFISDYVGEKPLRSYTDVFAKYPLALQSFVDQILVANLTLPYNNNRTTIPTFEKSYFTIEPKTIEISQSMRKEAVVRSIGKNWDKAEFSKEVHTPVTIGTVEDQETFVNQNVPRCLHLPIKLPGSDVRVPKEYEHFSGILEKIFNFEKSVNPGLDGLYAYLTVDQGFVPRANSQRVPGPHVDGIPRDRDNPTAQQTDHAYLVTNAIPTMFYLQQFDMTPYDPKVHHFFAIFRALSDESRTITVKPFEIGLMDAYSVHTPTQTQIDVDRTFVRLEFSSLEFDRLGNSVNPHFIGATNYPFTYVPRPIPSHLIVPPEVYANKPITNEDYNHESIDNFRRINLRAIFMQSNRYELKQSDYKDLDLIAKAIMDKSNQGFVIVRQGLPRAFCLYQIENKTIKLDTLFTLDEKGQELMVYVIKILNQLADRFSVQAGLKEGETPICIVVNDNNEKMLRFFLRAARLAKIAVNIEHLLPEPANTIAFMK